jgi:hypothetical protein
VEVLGRRGHRYDELESGGDGGTGDDDQPYIRESYTAEGRGVLALFACPKCGTRPGLKGELRRLGIWLLTLTVMLGLAVLFFLWLSNTAAAFGMGLAYAIAIVARGYAFVSAVIEAKDRVRVSPVQGAAQSKD